MGCNGDCNISGMNDGVVSLLAVHDWWQFFLSGRDSNCTFSVFIPVFSLFFSLPLLLCLLVLCVHEGGGGGGDGVGKKKRMNKVLILHNFNSACLYSVLSKKSFCFQNKGGLVNQLSGRGKNMKPFQCSVIRCIHPQ